MLDVVGYNYQEPRYPADHQKYPRRFIFGSENSHEYQQLDRGAGQRLRGRPVPLDGHRLPGRGQRLAEPGQQRRILDLCGFKKPNAWFRQSLWRDTPMVYLCAPAPPAGGRGRGGTAPRGEEAGTGPPACGDCHLLHQLP